MLVRTWGCRARAGAGGAYLAFLSDVMLPKIRTVPGNVGARVLKGRTDPDEFIVVTYWVDLEAIERFSGPDPEHAVVPPEARALLDEFDERARHYDVELQVEAAGSSAFRPPEVMETPRLRIRKLVEDDAEKIFEGWARDPEVTRFLLWSPHESVEESLAHAQRCVACWQDGTNFTWILEERETGAAVGSVAGYPSEHSVELAYLVARAAWGNGYMVEAVEAVSDWFLAQPMVYRVWAEVDAENVASARVLEKASFEKEGLIRRSIMSPSVSAEPRDALVYGRVR